MNTVFTIGRQFGSGGRQVGQELAERLGIPFYDKELIALSARESGLSESLFASADEKPAGGLFYSLMMGAYPATAGVFGAGDMPLNDQLFLIQSKTIKKLAEDGPCVIVGRCADYVLRDYPNMLSIFIHANLEERIKRAIDVYHIPEEKAEDTCLKTDKKRANFYNYYSDQKWGMCRTYHLSIDSSRLGINHCVDLILDYETVWREHDKEVKAGISSV